GRARPAPGAAAPGAQVRGAPAERALRGQGAPAIRARLPDREAGRPQAGARGRGCALRRGLRGRRADRRGGAAQGVRGGAGGDRRLGDIAAMTTAELHEERKAAAARKAARDAEAWARYEADKERNPRRPFW